MLGPGRAASPDFDCSRGGSNRQLGRERQCQEWPRYATCIQVAERAIRLFIAARRSSTSYDHLLTEKLL